MSSMKLGRIYKAREKFRKAQLHKRMSWQSAWQILKGFVSKQVSAQVACQWLGV